MDSDFLADSEKKLLTKRNIITLLLIGIILLAVPAGVRLVEQQQKGKIFASEDPIKFTGNVTCDQDSNDCTTEDPNIQLELNSPLGQPEAPEEEY